MRVVAEQGILDPALAVSQSGDQQRPVGVALGCGNLYRGGYGFNGLNFDQGNSPYGFIYNYLSR